MTSTPTSLIVRLTKNLHWAERALLIALVIGTLLTYLKIDTGVLSVSLVGLAVVFFLYAYKPLDIVRDENELLGFLSAVTIDDKTGDLKRHTLSSIWNIDKVRSYYDFSINNFYFLGGNAISLEVFKKYQNQDVTIKLNWLNK